jgi:hypothetical protein
MLTILKSGLVLLAARTARLLFGEVAKKGLLLGLFRKSVAVDGLLLIGAGVGKPNCGGSLEENGRRKAWRGGVIN